MEKTKAIANLIVEAVLLLNLILMAAGKNPIPFDEAGAGEMISYFLTGLQTLRVWWYNQNMTTEAETGQIIINEMKEKKDLGLQESNLEEPSDDPEE